MGNHHSSRPSETSQDLQLLQKKNTKSNLKFRFSQKINIKNNYGIFQVSYQIIYINLNLFKKKKVYKAKKPNRDCVA